MKKELFKKICMAMVLVLAFAMFVSDSSVAKADDEITVIWDVRNGTREYRGETFPNYEELTVTSGDNSVDTYNMYPNEGYRKIPVLTYNGSNVACPEGSSVWPWTGSGWNLIQSGDWTEVLGINVKEDATWIIEFQPIEYKIIFEPNGGSGNMSDATIKYGIETSLPKCTYTKGGYKCAGWSLEPNSEIVYSDGGSVLNLAIEDGAEITFYAQWEPAPAPDYNVPDTAVY